MIQAINMTEMMEELEKHRAEIDAIFEHDEKRGYITIKANYDYPIDLSRIPDPESLLRWIEHLTRKGWMTSELVGEFIRRIYTIKGWNLYSSNL